MVTVGSCASTLQDRHFSLTGDMFSPSPGPAVCNLDLPASKIWQSGNLQIWQNLVAGDLEHHQNTEFRCEYDLVMLKHNTERSALSGVPGMDLGHGHTDLPLLHMFAQVQRIKPVPQSRHTCYAGVQKQG